MDEPDPKRQHGSCGSRIDDAWACEPELMGTMREHRAACGEDVAAPVGLGAVDETHDEALARLLREHRRAVGAPGPAANVLNDRDRQRSGDADDDRIQQLPIDPGHEPAATPARPPSQEVRGESGREHTERATGQNCHHS